MRLVRDEAVTIIEPVASHANKNLVQPIEYGNANGGLAPAQKNARQTCRGGMPDGPHGLSLEV
jgi:hypothetical protein